MSELTPLEQFILDNSRVWPFVNEESAAISECGFTVNYATKDGFNKRIAEENRPSFDDHPDAKCFSCDEDGVWYKNNSKRPGMKGWVQLQKGRPIGGWKESLMIRPEETPVDKLGVVLGERYSARVSGMVTVKAGPDCAGWYVCVKDDQKFVLCRGASLSPLPPTDREMFVNNLRKWVTGVSYDEDLEALYDKGFRYMGD